jgi:hypothetical protein
VNGAGTLEPFGRTREPDAFHRPVIAAAIALGNRVWKSSTAAHSGVTAILAICANMPLTCDTHAFPWSGPKYRFAARTPARHLEPDPRERYL